MPLIQEILANLNGMKFFSKVDFCEGYWGIPLNEASKPITGFATRTKQYVWNVLPQGYVNAGNIFQSNVNKTLGDMLWKGAMPYVDDVIIYAKTLKEHLARLEEFFKKISEANFFLKLRKCEFLMEQMEFLGHTLTPQGLRPSDEKIRAISRLSPPKTPKAVQSFLGVGGFYRRYINNFAARTHNLRSLIKKGTAFNWTSEHQFEFEDIKNELCKAPILAYPDWNKTFVIQTDASIIGLGAVLMQLYDQGYKVVEYASRATSDCEKRYGISELECAAVIWAVDKFKFYISNTHLNWLLIIVLWLALKTYLTIMLNCIGGLSSYQDLITLSPTSKGSLIL